MGLDSRKMHSGVHRSECLLFGSLISTYLVYREEASSAVSARDPDIPVTSFRTRLLMRASDVLPLAGAARRHEAGKLWLLVTALLASSSSWQFWSSATSCTRAGLTTNLRSPSYVLTGYARAAHVTSA